MGEAVRGWADLCRHSCLEATSRASREKGCVCSDVCTIVLLCLPVPGLLWTGSGEGVQEVRRRGWRPLIAEECAPEPARWSLVAKTRREADLRQHHHQSLRSSPQSARIWGFHPQGFGAPFGLCLVQTRLNICLCFILLSVN